MEGRAARWRLRGVELGRAHRVRRRGRRDRGERGDARRRAAQLPGRRPGQGLGGPQRHRHRALVADQQPRPGPGARPRPRPAERDLRGPDHPAEGPPAVPPGRGPAPAGRAADPVRGCAGHQGDRGRGARPGRRTRADAQRRGVDRRDAPPRRRGRAAHRRDRVRLSLDLRAARHREPGGDGVRDGRGRHRDRWHPRGGRRRRDRLAGADRAGPGRHRHARCSPGSTSRTSPPR